MKKWFARAGFIILLGILVLFGAAFWSDRDTQIQKGSIRADGLELVKPDWPGNAVDQRGRFINHEHPFLPRSRDLLAWQLSGNAFKEEKLADKWRPEVRDPAKFLSGDDDGILWMGHATFFIRLDGVSILTDPVFDTPTFVKRYVEVPSQLSSIRKVDLVLLSHDHRDHTDEPSLRKIAERFPDAAFLGGLRMEDILNQWKMPTNPVRTAGWFQKFDVEGPVNIYFLPVRHWSRRGLFDTNHRLWGGYVIKGQTASIYFGGDSGYGRHYGEAGELFPGIDYFLMGIGAYEPRWFMEANHNNPADVVKAFRDAGAKTLVPMHYGTFDLSDEPPGQPLKLLLSEAIAAGLAEKVKPLDINEAIFIGGATTENSAK